MYRTYLKKSLNITDLRITSKSTSPDIKYCNGLCQDYRCEKEFTNLEPLCINCKRLINTAMKQVKENKITIEQFKENPEIINGIEVVYDTPKTCTVCKESKTINHFDSNKSQCKACRAIQASERNNKDIDILCSDIEKIKTDLHKLENFVQSIPKDRLIKVISRFEIGRKSSDRKDKMIFNIVEHFRKIQKPTLCLGGCGFNLSKEFTYCKPCEEKKEKPRRAEKMVNFEDNLDEFIEKLVEITEEMNYKYNKSQFMMIAKKLNVKLHSKDRKDKIITLISEELKKINIEKQKLNEDVEIKNELGGKIELNGILVLSREDGYINATALCKAGGKQFKHWNSLDSTKELVTALESEVGIPTTKLLDIKKGGDSKLQGSWIHPDLAVQLAQWLSPVFALKVSKWVRELALTGSVVVGDEKTHQQLINLQNEIINQKETIKSLENKHNKFLEKQKYHQFKEGPVFYIISDNDSKSIKFKPGIEGCDINRRLAEHRSTTPEIKLEYLIYTKDNLIIEKNILKRYKVKRIYQNHEWIYEITKDNIIESVKVLLDFLNIEYTEEKNLEEYNKHIEEL